MHGQVRGQRVNLTKLAWGWLIGAFIATLISALWLPRFDTATELRPDHSDILEYCFWASGAIGVASALIGHRRSDGPLGARVVMSVVCFGGLSALGAFSVLSTAAKIVENRRDFPPEITRTFTALLPIERAYRSDSKYTSSWTIQPAPIWANIDIKHEDYSLMTSRALHLAEGDNEPSDVSSRGFFCAKVVMQQAGDALRVLHAGSQPLPEGSVGVCSEMASNGPGLKVIR